MKRHQLKPKKSSFLGRLIDALFSVQMKEALMNQLEKLAVKAILKKFVVVGGFRAWLIKFVVGELIEEADEKLIEPAFRKIGFVGDVAEGKKIYRKVSNAQDVDDWRDSIGRV